MGDSSLINLGELSKPATVLIEKVSDAVGGIFKPYQIVRVAKAEAEAELIKAESQIQTSDLMKRAFYRFLEEESKRQKNIENITQQALPHLEEKSQPDKMEDDWITNFFDKCRLISDGEMQGLWSRVLAGEANSPGTYSKRTVNFLSGLDKTDAELFTRLCGFGWIIGNVIPLVYDIQNDIYGKQGLNFGALSHLDSIGLIQFDAIAGFQRTKLPKRFSVHYFGEPLHIEMPKDTDNSMNLGHVLLTKTGHELYPICGSRPIEGFVDYVREKWASFKYIKNESLEQNNSVGVTPEKI